MMKEYHAIEVQKPRPADRREPLPLPSKSQWNRRTSDHPQRNFAARHLVGARTTLSASRCPFQRLPPLKIREIPEIPVFSPKKIKITADLNPSESNRVKVSQTQSNLAVLGVGITCLQNLSLACRAEVERRWERSEGGSLGTRESNRGRPVIKVNQS